MTTDDFCFYLQNRPPLVFPGFTLKLGASLLGMPMTNALAYCDATKKRVLVVMLATLHISHSSLILLIFLSRRCQPLLLHIYQSGSNTYKKDREERLRMEIREKGKKEKRNIMQEREKGKGREDEYGGKRGRKEK
jgi:hypothetical protein